MSPQRNRMRDEKPKYPEPGTVPKSPQSIFNLERKRPQRVLRRFLARGGKLVEVEGVIKETRG
jgi:hypothetical protein